MGEIIAILVRLMPVVLLIVLGIILHKVDFLRAETVNDLKKIVINLTLPSMLVLAFLGTDIELKYLVIALAVFLASAAGFGLGFLYKRLLRTGNRYFPTVFTSFETGMIGYALYVTAFGAENTFNLAIADLGNILFVFIVVVNFLSHLGGETKGVRESVSSFARSPIIISVVLGSLVSLSGGREFFQTFPVTAALVSTMGILSQVTVPVIALAIGYEIRLDVRNLLKPVGVSLLRIVTMFLLAYVLNTFLMGPVLGMDRNFQMALYTMFLLPPAFVVPIFVKEESEDVNFVLNVLSVHIILSMAAFVLLISF
jgi:predicted permease